MFPLAGAEGLRPPRLGVLRAPLVLVCLSRLSALLVCLGWLCGGVSNRHGFHWVPSGSWALFRADSTGRAGGIEVYGSLELKENWKVINLNSLTL